MRSQRDNLISHSRRGLHRGQRSMTAQVGRTYDRIVPVAPSFDKVLASGAVPHMNVLRQRVPSKPKMTVASCSRRTPMICSSVNLVRFIVRLPSKTDSTHFWRSFRGSGHRRAHFIQGMTIKEIVRDLRVSGNTVRKVVRTGADGVFRPHPPDPIMGGPQCRSRREARTLRLTSTPDCWRNLKARDTNPPNRDGDKSTSKLQTSTRQ